MDSAVEAARWIAEAADEVSASAGESRKETIKRLNAATGNQYAVVQISRALISTTERAERLRDLLNDVIPTLRYASAAKTSAGNKAGASEVEGNIRSILAALRPPKGDAT